MSGILVGTDHLTRQRMRKELAELFQAELDLWPKNIRNIEDLKTASYPSNILLPDLGLNFPVEPGRFRYALGRQLDEMYGAHRSTRYHRDFLLQFMNICTKQPASLVTLESIGIEPRNTAGAGGRGGPRGGRLGSHQAGAMSADAQLFPLLGNSQSRFEASTREKFGALPSAGGTASRLTPMSRSVGQEGVGGGGARETKRTRSQRGRDRGENKRSSGPQAPANLTEPLDYAPLEHKDDAWVADSTQRNSKLLDERQLVDRKVKSLLNKLTTGNFDPVSDQVIEWTNRSEGENDGSTLMQVIKLIFEQAKEGAVLSETYARLCRKTMERVSPNIQDQTIRNSEGRPITGGMLFRKYLVNRCQEDFENESKANEIALACARLKFEDEAAQSSRREPHSDEDYIRAKAKRHAVGLVCLMGELLKLQMLPERAIHECVKKLLSNVINPEEAEILSLRALLMAAGRNLDNVKARNHMDIYFERMQDMAQNSNINRRMQFMLLDIIELRARKWQPRPPVPRPIPIPLRQGVPRKDSDQQGGASGGFQWNGRRDNNTPERNNWRATGTGGAGTSRPAVRAGDLSQFGKISKPTGVPFGPSSVFGKGGTSTRDPRIDSGVNMFSGLGGGGVFNRSRPLVGFSAKGKGADGTFEPSESPATAGTSGRKKLNLLPRTKPDEVH